MESKKARRGGCAPELNIAKPTAQVYSSLQPHALLRGLPLFIGSKFSTSLRLRNVRPPTSYLRSLPRFIRSEIAARETPRNLAAAVGVM